MPDDYTRERNQELASLRSRLSALDRDEDPREYERVRRRYEAVHEGWHARL